MTGYQVDPSSPLPRYYQVYDSLSTRIRERELLPGVALPSERQLAVDYGVSRITIVKALDMLVADGLIDRQHGRGNFVCDQSEPDVAPEEPRVAFCVPSPSESYIFSILRGAVQEAVDRRCYLQILDSGDGEEEMRCIEDILARGFDGLLLFSRSAHLNADFYRDLQRREVPFVMVDRYCLEVQTDVVLFDDEDAVYQLTEELVQRGHRRIALITGEETFATSVQDRTRGYRYALETYGIDYDEGLVGDGLFGVLGLAEESIEELRDSYADFLNRVHESGPTAVIAINNYVAEQLNADLAKIQMRLMQAVIDSGETDIDYELQLSLSLVSHRPLTFQLTPLVTTAIQRGEILGARAMAFLRNRIIRTVTGPPRTTLIPMELQASGTFFERKGVHSVD